MSPALPSCIGNAFDAPRRCYEIYPWLEPSLPQLCRMERVYCVCCVSNGHLGSEVCVPWVWSQDSLSRALPACARPASLARLGCRPRSKDSFFSEQVRPCAVGQVPI